MKKWVALLFVCIYANSFSQTNISPQFSELKGMEDQFSNTHLFYRIYSSYEDYYIYNNHNDIYHLDFTSGADTLFLEDYTYENPAYAFHISVEDYKFWNKDFTKFIIGGSIGYGDTPIPYIQRFDGDLINFEALWGAVHRLGISNQNDSIIFAGGYFVDTSYNPLEVLNSVDGGWNWTAINDTLMFLSLNPFNDNIFFLENGYGFLYRSTDAGNTFNLVDVLNQPSHSTSFIYDPDQLHIYRLFGNRTLRVSSDNGEPFSWQTKYSSDAEIFISNDESKSGNIYLADKKNIFLSTDHGNNFNLYKTLDRKIVGIYKKPNSNKLYAATKYKIYEITADTVQVIKSLPIADEELKFYPLAIGNKWVYDTWGWWWDGTIYHTYSGIIYREVIGDTILENGQFYYKLFDPTTFNYPYYLFERIDSSSGKVFRYDNTLGLPNNEYLIDNLFAELGDTVWSSRHQYQDFIPFICVGQGNFNKWGIQGSRKIFTIFDLTGYTYSLAQGIGVDSVYSSFDFGENFTAIKGCIINGIVYGDTTLTDVGNEETPIATEFRLEQNYPNPFNPSTKIKFTIPSVGTQRSVSVQLKVYDVLGNEIATLINEEKPAGEYEVEFSGHSDGGQNLSSGIYFYQLVIRGSEINSEQALIQTKKMILLK